MEKVVGIYESQSRLLKAMREKHNLTQDDVADFIGTSKQYISKIERGLAPLSLKHWRKLSIWVSLDKVEKAFLRDKARVFDKKTSLK